MMSSGALVDLSATPTAAKNILIVEDEEVVAEHLRSSLVRLGYEVVDIAISGSEAVACALSTLPDLVLMDIQLDGPIDGIRATQEINKQIDCPVVYLTSCVDEQTLSRAKTSSPFGYLIKPFRLPELRCVIEIALHKHELEAKLREQKQWFSTTLQSLAEAVVATDVDGNISFMNPAAEQLSGWASTAACGKLLEEVIHLVDRQTMAPLANPVARALRMGAVQTPEGQVALISRTGKAMAVDSLTTPIMDNRGRILGGVMVIRNTTARAHHEADLRRIDLEPEQHFARASR
jgi:PAS domain S-box-containing protein